MVCCEAVGISNEKSIRFPPACPVLPDAKKRTSVILSEAKNLKLIFWARSFGCASG
jgi:hypothetical protein